MQPNVNCYFYHNTFSNMHLQIKITKTTTHINQPISTKQKCEITFINKVQCSLISLPIIEFVSSSYVKYFKMKFWFKTPKFLADCFFPFSGMVFPLRKSRKRGNIAQSGYAYSHYFQKSLLSFTFHLRKAKLF